MLRGDLERVLHLPDSVTIMTLSGAEYGLKLGSQLFIKHIVESGLAAKGNSLQEGDLILKVWGPQGTEPSLGVSSAPLWRACPWLVSLQGPATAVLEAVLSVPTPCPSCPGCPRDPAGTLRAEIPAARAGGMSCWHSGVLSTPLSPQYVVPHCVFVSPLDDSHRCLSDKTVFKVFGEEQIEGRETLCLPPTPGRGRPVAAGNWCQGDSGVNIRDYITQSVGKSSYHSERSQPHGLMGPDSLHQAGAWKDSAEPRAKEN